MNIFQNIFHFFCFLNVKWGWFASMILHTTCVLLWCHVRWLSKYHMVVCRLSAQHIKTKILLTQYNFFCKWVLYLWQGQITIWKALKVFWCEWWWKICKTYFIFYNLFQENPWIHKWSHIILWGQFNKQPYLGPNENCAHCWPRHLWKIFLKIKWKIWIFFLFSDHFMFKLYM